MIPHQDAYSMGMYPPDAATARGNSFGTPGGCCNYSDLSLGSSGAKCGCQRFWSKGEGEGSTNGRSWCACGHHACFHEAGGGQSSPTLQLPPIQLQQQNQQYYLQQHPQRVPQQQQQHPQRHSQRLQPLKNLQSGMSPPSGRAPSRGQENQRQQQQRPYQNLPSPVQTPLAPNLPPMMPHAGFAGVGPVGRMDDYAARLAMLDNIGPDPYMPETLPWGGHGPPHHDVTEEATISMTQMATLPSPYQNQSRPGSVASTQSHYLRPFSGRGLHTLGGPHGPLIKRVLTTSTTALEPTQAQSLHDREEGGGAQPRTSGPHSQERSQKHRAASSSQPRNNTQDEPTQELTPTSTQPATPGSTQDFSQQAQGYGFRFRSPALVVKSFDEPRARMARAKSVPLAQVEMADKGGPSKETNVRTTALSLPNAELHLLMQAVKDHGIRITAFENMSFARGYEECGERYDQLDMKAADFEVRMREVERFVENAQTARTEGHSMLSVASASTTATNNTAKPLVTNIAQLHEQLQSLQNRVMQLQTYVPSVTNPWEIEVVFLPFAPRRLWMNLGEFKLEGGQDEWTQLSNASGRPMRAQSPASAGWTDKEHDHQWLLPRAVASDSIIHHRLRSRGLVHTISAKSPDARTVRLAIDAALAPVLEAMKMSDSDRAPLRQMLAADSRVSRFMGLQQTWVPLRKLHRDSRLRFLTPSEMITPSLWDVSFLNSILMRVSERRLFVTQPEAYLQGRVSIDLWSWPVLQQLRVPGFEGGGGAETELSFGKSLDGTPRDSWSYFENIDDPPGCAPPTTPQKGQFSPSSRRVSASPAPSMRAIAAAGAMRRRAGSPLATSLMVNTSAPTFFTEIAPPPPSPLSKREPPSPLSKREPPCVPVTKERGKRSADAPPTPRHLMRNASMPPAVSRPLASPTSKRRSLAEDKNQGMASVRSSNPLKRRRTGSSNFFSVTNIPTPSPAPDSQSQRVFARASTMSIQNLTPHSNPFLEWHGRDGKHSSADNARASTSEYLGHEIESGNNGGDNPQSQESSVWPGIASDNESDQSTINNATVEDEDTMNEEDSIENDEHSIDDNEEESAEKDLAMDEASRESSPPSEYRFASGDMIRIKKEDGVDSDSESQEMVGLSESEMQTDDDVE